MSRHATLSLRISAVDLLTRSAVVLLSDHKPVIPLILRSGVLRRVSKDAARNYTYSSCSPANASIVRAAPTRLLTKIVT